MPLDVLEQGEVGHVLVCNAQHDIGGIAVVEDVVVCCAESCEILVHFGSFLSYLCERFQYIIFERKHKNTKHKKPRKRKSIHATRYFFNTIRRAVRFLPPQ